MSEDFQVFDGRGVRPSKHPFERLQPLRYEGRLVQRHSLGIEHKGFEYDRKGDQKFTVASTRGHGGTLSRTLSYSHLMTADADVLSFRGALGEQVARIIIDEYLHRHAGTLNFAWWQELQSKERQQQEPLRSGSRCDLWNERRYNLLVLEGSQIVSGFDGGWEYEHTTGKGVVVMESKTGNLNGLSADDDKNKSRLYDRIVSPLHDLFPDHRIDYLLMAPSDILFTPVAYDQETGEREIIGRTFRKGVVTLAEYLRGQNIGFIGLDFPLARTTLLAHAQRAFKLAQAMRRGPASPRPEEELQGDEWFMDGDGNFHLRNQGSLEFMLGSREGLGYYRDYARRRDFRNGAGTKQS